MSHNEAGLWVRIVFRLIAMVCAAVALSKLLGLNFAPRAIIDWAAVSVAFTFLSSQQ